MKIEGVIWLRAVVDKLVLKHHVQPQEVEEVLGNKPKFRRIEKGSRRGEDVYRALGQTDAGRYIAVLFIYKRTKKALILSAQGHGPEREKTVWREINPRACLHQDLSTTW